MSRKLLLGSLQSTHTSSVRSTGAEMTQLLNQLKFTCIIVVIQNGFLLESLQLQHHGLDLRGTHSWQKTGRITQQSWGQCSLNMCGCNDHKVKVTPGQQVSDWLWNLKTQHHHYTFLSGKVKCFESYSSLFNHPALENYHYFEGHFFKLEKFLVFLLFKPVKFKRNSLRC